jgi:hypothetical protein
MKTLSLSLVLVSGIASLALAQEEGMIGIMQQPYLYCSADATEGDASSYVLILEDAAKQPDPSSIRVIKHDGTDWQTVKEAKVEQASDARVSFADGGKGRKYTGQGFTVLRGTETTPNITNDRAELELQVEGQTIRIQTTCSTVS